MSTPTTNRHSHGDEAADQYLKQLGRLVIAMARLETTSHAIVRAMGVDGLSLGLSSALPQVRARAERAMPPWVSVRGEDLCRWSEISEHALDERDRLVAAAGAHRFSGSDGDAPRVTASDGTVYPADERYLDRLIARVHRHELIGRDIATRLDYLDAKGATWPLGGWHLDFRDPGRADEMSWYPGHLAQLPSDWRAWLESEAAEVA